MNIEHIGIVTERVCYLTSVFVLGAIYHSIKSVGIPPEAAWVTVAAAGIAIASYALSKSNDRINNPTANV